MRARHRHFNARDCDAALCLDARFISGKSNNDDVQTWSDRSRNAADATQNTLANRPLYKTSIQGGQPIVMFDGSADANGDFYPMTTVLEASLNNKQYAYVLVVVKDNNRTAGAPNHTVFYVSSNTASVGRAILRTRQASNNNFASQGRRLDGDSISTASQASNDNFNIIASELNYNSNVNNLFVNGVIATTATFSSGGGSTSNTNSANVEIGRGNLDASSNAAPIELGQLVFLNTSISSSLNKRLHHHAAFSFKLACD